jgi:hypothetical protein
LLCGMPKRRFPQLIGFGVQNSPVGHRAHDNFFLGGGNGPIVPTKKSPRLRGLKASRGELAILVIGERWGFPSPAPALLKPAISDPINGRMLFRRGM